MTPENLKAWRARLGLGDVGMAAYLGVPLGTLRKWENGTRTPDTAPLRLFAVLQLIEAQAPELHAAILAAAKAGAGAQDAPQRARKGRGRVTGAPGPENAPAARGSARIDPPTSTASPAPWIAAADALPPWMTGGPNA
jgi:transcriptional regulator with XRE-family HTH domain